MEKTPRELELEAQIAERQADLDRRITVVRSRKPIEIAAKFGAVTCFVAIVLGMIAVVNGAVLGLGGIILGGVGVYICILALADLES